MFFIFDIIRKTSAGGHDTVGAVAVDRQPTDYFAMNTGGIENQGKSLFTGNNTVAVTGFVYEITFNQTRSNATYLVNANPEIENAGGCVYCEIRSKTTTGFIVVLKTCANGTPSGINPNINITVYA